MSDTPEPACYDPIGYIRCDEKYRFEVPRQAVLAENEGCIELLPHLNYDQAASDLDGFDRIWVIYQFHLNTNWKPFVRPPRLKADRKKISVFATRAPHRPNMIGLSCVELVAVDGLKLRIRNFDILDGSPVLDIKPYVPYCDSFPESATGWLPEGDGPDEYSCEFEDLAREQIKLIYDTYKLDLANFAALQLKHEPTNPQTKRIRVTDKEKNEYFLGCRTWRIHFRLDDNRKCLIVQHITTGYNDYELVPDAHDPYSDKDFHRDFMTKYFGNHR